MPRRSSDLPWHKGRWIQWLRAATYRVCVPPCQRLYVDGRGRGLRLYREFSTGSSRSVSMMSVVGIGVGCCIHWAGVMGKGLGGVLSCVRFSGTIVTLGVDAGGVSVGTLGDGAGQSVWSAPAGASRGVFGVTAVGGLSVTFEKMHESFCMSENCSSPSVANGVGVGCKRDSANVWAAVVAVLVEIPAGKGQSCGKNSTVLAMRSSQLCGMCTRWHW